MWRRFVVMATVFVLVLCFADLLSAGSRKFSCTSGGRVYRITLGTSGVFETTLMWTKGSPDNDLALFDPVDGTMLGIGVGLAERYEHIAIGGLAGFQVDVLAIKASGPNGACVLRWTNQLTNLSGGREARLRDLGSLDELAAADPKYALIRERMNEYLRLKRVAD